MSNIPLLLSTQQAARYIAGRDVHDNKPVSTKRFLAFVEACGITPSYEATTVSTRKGARFVYKTQRWSKIKIDKVLENPRQNEKNK